MGEVARKGLEMGEKWLLTPTPMVVWPCPLVVPGSHPHPLCQSGLGHAICFSV